MEELIILGYTTSHFYMILDILKSLNLNPKIYIFDNQNRCKEKLYDIDIIYDLKKDSNFTLGFAKPNGKYSFISSQNLNSKNFINLIHSSSVLSSFSNIGHGIRIEPLCTIANNTVLEDFVHINRNSSIGHDCVISKFSTINPSVSIASNVFIGERTEIGIGTTIINNIKIGKNTIIGAGSVVTKDIPDNVIAWGSPCKIIKNFHT